MSQTFIYVLVCPRTGEVRYVGKANDIKHRLSVHRSNARRNAHTVNARWMKSIEDAGLDVAAVVLHQVRGDVAWQVMERLFIATAMHMGMRLNNGTKGGEGVDIPAEDIERVKALRRAGVTEEVLRKMGASNAISWARAEVRQRRIDAFKLAASTPEARERLRKAATKPRSEEAKTNRLAAVAAYYADPQNKAKAAERMRAIGKANSGRTGKPLSEDHKAACRAGWAKRRAALATGL